MVNRSQMTKFAVFSTKGDSFLNGGNSVYAEQMYESWREDPKR